MIQRLIIPKIQELLEQFPAVAIVGPRQVGKTTIAKEIENFINKEIIYLDLENPRDLAKLNDPILFFESQEEKCVILDEIQRKKELFPILRSMIDSNRVPSRFVILGSASPDLIRNSSETLAGRIYYQELFPLNCLEVNTKFNIETHWLRGGFPDSILSKNDNFSMRWRESFIQTYIERDLPLLGFPINPTESRKFIKMMAHLNGQLINYSTLSKSLGVSSPSIKKYIYFLEQAFLIRLLEPYYVNSGKRLVKSPKVYFRDTGILHAVNFIETIDDLLGHPEVGNSWECYVIEQITSILPGGLDIFFYKTQQGAEMDVIITKGNNPILGIEIKLSSSPHITKGTYIAMQDLKLPKCYIVIPTNERYLLQKNIEAISVDKLLDEILNLK